MADQKRVLTEKEKARLALLEETTKKLEAKGLKKYDKTIGVVFANVMAGLVFLPFLILYVVLFVSLRDAEYVYVIDMVTWAAIFIGFILSIFVHEGLHGLGWGLFAKSKFKAIEFGFIVKMLTPYCCCKEPLKKSTYIFGCLLPLVILGIIPCTISVFNGSLGLLGFGLLGIMGAGGDIIIAIKMLATKFKSEEALVIDHPTDCGFVVFDK